jgi:CRP/FNR family transcriptional regulator, cyclic AMP receptor protein
MYAARIRRTSNFSLLRLWKSHNPAIRQPVPPMTSKPSTPSGAQPGDSETLDDGLLRKIAAKGGVRTYPPNSIIINEGEKSDTFFILLSGRVKVYGSDAAGNQVVYATHGTGEYVGEMTLDGGTRTASVMTLEKTTCAVVSGAELRDFIAEHPDFALNLVRKLIRRAREATEGVKNLALLDVYGRICVLLMSLAEPDDSPGAGGAMRIRERLTQQDIADRVGSSREMVSRIFKDLTAGGYLAMDSGKLRVLRKLPAHW